MNELLLKSTISFLLSKAPAVGKWAWGLLPANKPIARAIREVCRQYGTRLPNLENALIVWAEHETFRAHKHEMERGGGAANLSSAHVEMFSSSTGIVFDTADRRLLLEMLQALYRIIKLNLPPRTMAATLENIQAQVATPEPEHKRSPFPIQTSQVDEPAIVQSKEDQLAEQKLNSIKTLIDNRQATAALALLAELERGANEGAFSASLRCRFHLNKGICLLLLHRVDDADADFSTARVLEPGSAKVLINLAQVSLIRGNVDAAMELLNDALSKDPANAVALALKLVALHEIGKKDDARALAADNPDILESTDCLYALGFIAFDEGRFSEAEHYARQHNERNATRPEAWELLGRSLLVPAQKELKHTAVDPEWELPQQLREGLEEAEECFTKAETLASTRENRDEMLAPLVNRGATRVVLHKYDEARRDFERALEIRPDSPEANLNLANLHQVAFNDPNRALPHYEALQSTSLKGGTLAFFATALNRVKNYAKVKSLLQPVLDSPPNSESVVHYGLYLEACRAMDDLNGIALAVSHLESFETSESYRIRSEDAARRGDSQGAIEFMTLAVACASPTQVPRYRLGFADLLYRYLRFSEAAEQYAAVPVPETDTSECCRYVVSLIQGQRWGDAMGIILRVRAAYPDSKDFAELEATIREQTGALAEAIRIRQDLANVGKDSTRQLLKIALSQCRLDRLEAAKLSTMAVSLDDVSEDPELLRDAAVLRTDLGLPDALEFALRRLQLEPKDPEAHLFYISIFFSREAVDAAIIDRSTVAPGMVVTIRQGADVHSICIGSGLIAGTDEALESDHPFAVAMLGKSAGDKVIMKKGEIGQSEFEILAITSKFVHAFQNCLNRFNQRFPEHAGVSRIEVSEQDITNVVVMASQRRQYADKVLALYATGRFPACGVAKMLGQTDLEFFRALILDETKTVFSFAGDPRTRAAETSALLSAPRIILEASALVTLGLLDLLPALASTGIGLDISQFTIDQLREVVANIRPSNKQGFIVSDSPGSVRIAERSEAELVETKQFFEGLQKFVLSNCTPVAPSTTQALEQFGSPKLRGLLGPQALSAAMCAASTGGPLLCDDLALRALVGNEYGLRSASTFGLLDFLRQHGHIEPDDYRRALKTFALQRFVFVSVSVDDVLWILREANWKPTHEVAQFLTCLGPPCDEQTALAICLEVMHGIASQLLPKSSQILLSDLLLDAIASGRTRNHVVTGLRHLNSRRSAIWTPASEMIDTILRSWLLKNR